MTKWKLMLRSLRFHARSHLGVVLGAAVGTAVLLGALLVGDSVRGSLRDLALARLGKTTLALASNDRLFRAALADDLRAGLNNPGAAVAPVLLLPGTASCEGGEARANHVQVAGVDERFWKLANQQPAFANPAEGQVILNQPLAEQLKVKVGDRVLIRVPKPTQLSRDAPLSPEEDATSALRVKVQAIATDAEFGRFGLQASQVAPFNAFVSREWLAKQVKAAHRANLLLVSGDEKSVTVEFATRVLKEKWQLADADLNLREVPAASALELRTERVFLDIPVVEAALKSGGQSQQILTYFVNELKIGAHAVPYSMVAALGAPIVPPDMKPDEIIINQWLADDLKAKPDDSLDLTYYVVGTARKLEERTHSFRVRAIVPLQGAAADRDLMPDFPGMTDAKNCREWDTGFPINLGKIRDEDNKYWENYRGTPKAFITLAAGQKLWSNRFGDATAVRYPLASVKKETVQANLLKQLDPSSVGLGFQPARELALKAVHDAQDFGQLFIGFSFFLIVAALLLMALLFQFGVEQRAVEVGTLLAVGWTPKQVRNQLLCEGSVLSVIGGFIGIIGGVYYAQAMLFGLSTMWRDAVGTSALHYHAEPETLVTGALSGIVVAFLTIWFALRRQARQPARELLAEGAEERRSRLEGTGRGRWAWWIAIISTVGGLGLVGWAATQRENAAESFFGAGALLLLGGLAFAAVLLAYLDNRSANNLAQTATHPQSPALHFFSLLGLGLRNATRRRKRSLATLGLLASGSFLIVAVSANRLDAGADAQKRSSGTGGFALLGESSLPVVQDLNADAGRQFYALEAKPLSGATVVPFRVRNGEDASCLNLNHAQKPRLLGIHPELLDTRKAFTFTGVAKGLSPEHPWLLLHRDPKDDAIPAIGDEASIQWAMGKNVGDTMTYTDERGREFKLRLVGAVANSILQGNLLIDEAEFVKRFPSESGYRLFLIDAPADKAANISQILSRGLQDVGLELTPATKRLAAYNAVQNTYLGTFQALGGLGLLLGSVGLGVVVLRNVLERRGELALLLAIGFRARSLKWLIISEHGALLLLGLLLGTIAALVAVLPALLTPGSEIPYALLAWTLGGVFLSGALWTWIATLFALRGQLLDALRDV